ncbi:MAG TPA: 4a-hydroxytetrahydrobiopterin dehydratase [Actinomycetota bacterium]|nr:4a-hydroxytetrahydrobiopterin dehydratase [Actinomycetota bacterium]
MAKLTDAELEAFLSDAEGWTAQGDAIQKDFVFPGFRAAIAFVNRVAERADAARHHPDIEIHYNRVRISLSTHDAGGVTEKDVALAAEIDVAAEGDDAAEPGGG